MITSKGKEMASAGRDENIGKNGEGDADPTEREMKCVTSNKRDSSQLFETAVGQALRNVNTSNQWSTLTGVLTKVNKKLPARQQLDARTLAELLSSEPSAELARNGIWTTSFGANYMPIVVVNRSYARKIAEGGEQGHCSCGHGDGGAGSSRFFGSQDYNAGRHALEASGHKVSCLCWTPPTTGHLHSWRRGFDEYPSRI
ncbi:unnamed protein product [Pylaiella littoralis]